MRTRAFLLFSLFFWLSGPAMAEQVSVQINWKHQFEFAAFYAALEQGYYRDAGLDVSIHEGGPGIDAVKEVVEGRADFGVGTSALVVERYHGQPVMALASLMQHSPIALMALRRNGVNSVHDLAGRPVAVDPHSRDEIDAYLRAAGIPPASIRFVDQTDWTLTSLEQGREAAKVVYVPNEPFFIRGREHEFIILRPQSAGIDLFGNILFGTQAMVEGRPDTVKAFRDATLKGLVYALEHPDELADLIHDRYNTQNKSREHLLFEAEQIRELTRPDIVEPGYMSAGRWQHVVNVYAGQGKMPANFNLDGFLFEPMPHKLPAWLVNSLLASVMLLLVTAAFMIRLRFINRKLAHEMVERRDAEQKLAERERILAAIIDNEPECVKLLDKDGLLLRMNPAGLHMIEADSEAQVLGKRVEGLVLPPYKVPFVKLLHKVFRGERGTLEFEIQGMRGGRRWLETHAVPLRNETGEITRLLGVTRDVTARKQAEAELDRYQRGLEEVVAERTSELIAARDEAERLARVKSEFLANMSHEIRTPLNAVLGFARMGARDSAGRSCRETFGRIREAGEHLLGVINDILDFSKLDAGKLTVERHAFQLGAVLANTASIVTGTARHKGLAFAMEAAPDLPEWVMSDPQRLQQILINLLSNAVKFTAAGEVRLRVAREGDLAYFRVTDTGIGMHEEQLSRLFKPFEQADSTTTRNYGGTGLGLAISRDLANLMGGEITVESAPGQGSAFTLRLPLPTAQPALPAHTEPAAGPRLTGIKVLAAEDVEANRLILEDLLVQEGVRVTFAAHGRQALERLEEMGASAFDVVLMDVQMPEMDGYEATQRILELAPGLPVIGLTAHALAEERQRCLAAGMAAHVTKPIDADELVAAIRRQVSLPEGAKPASGMELVEGASPDAPSILIDWPAMLARYGGRQAFIDKLLATVRDSQADTPGKLRQAAQDRDLEAIAFLAHAVKGMAGNLMAIALREMAAKTEVAARSGQDDAGRLAGELADRLDEMLAELTRRLQKGAG